MKPGDAEYDAAVQRNLDKLRGNVSSDKLTEQQMAEEIKTVTEGAFEGEKSCPAIETEKLIAECRANGLLPRKRGRPKGSRNKPKAPQIQVYGVMVRESEKALKRLANDYLWQRISKTSKPWIDIGCGDCQILGAEGWDKAEGDAQTLPGVSNGAYGLVFSSHCLEHLENPKEALTRWFEVTKHEGYLWILVPDWELYEHCIWPSRFNPDHKHRFTINTLWHLINQSIPHAKVLRLQIVDSGYDYSLSKDIDQTLTGAEACIETVLQKL